MAKTAKTSSETEGSTLLSFFFPSLDRSIQASSLEEAQVIAQKLIEEQTNTAAQ